MAEAPSDPFVMTPYLERLARRALRYLEAGLAVHLRGPAGTGKTSLAFHLARRLGRPTHVIYGNESFRGLDLAGRQAGRRKRLEIDNFDHRIHRRIEEDQPVWVNGRLLLAARDGGTLIYDEFTRSRPGANNVLLSVLEEGVIEVPGHRTERGGLVRVHPDFRAIFTSNPGEYAGVHKGMDALSDRMVTLDMTGRDFETDVAIVARRSGLSSAAARRLLQALDQKFEASGKVRGSLRPALMVARIVKHARISLSSPAFAEVCEDILGGE